MEYMSDSDSVMSTSEYQRRVALAMAGVFIISLAPFLPVGVLWPATSGDYPLQWIPLIQVAEWLRDGVVALRDFRLHLMG